MAPPPESHFGTLPRAALVGMILAAMLLVLAVLAPLEGLGNRLVLAVAGLATALPDAGLAGMIVVAAGGWGFLLCRRLMPTEAPLPLRAITACGAGLWAMSTAMLIVGSAVPGTLNGWVWWPVVAGGVLLAAWQGRRHMETWCVPPRFDGRVLAWVLVAAAAAIWISGAVCEPARAGSVPTHRYDLDRDERYDVLEYHLQVPREHYEAGRIRPLTHNVYSYYPLGLEMLYLMAMCLRGGAYAGMFAAQFLHGGLAAMTVAALFLALRKAEPTRARSAAVLLATTPAVLYLSRMAMVEMGELFYLAMAMLWLREWLSAASWRSAACAGLMLGGSCAVKYLSVGLVVGPVLAAMIAAVLILRRWRQAWHLAAAGAAALLLLAPWLVWNTVSTGNPVFPLATRVFGRGHWAAESQQRWINGHSAQARPPVPVPTGWQPAPAAGRAENFVRNFVTRDLFGYVMMFVGGLTVALMVTDRRQFGPWDFSLAAVLALQLIVWTLSARDMPWRFIVPAMVPMCLLAGAGLQKLSGFSGSPFRPGAPAGGVPWGRAPAVGLLIAAAVVNLITAVNVAAYEGALIPPARPQDLSPVPPGSRVLLVGQCQAFYCPTGAIYATAFDEHPLAAMVREAVSPERIGDRLRDMGVTHVLVDWYETSRLAHTYGYPGPLSEGLYERYVRGLPPALPVLEALRRTHGLYVYREDRLSRRRSETAASRPASGPATARARADWPVVTVYAFPWAPRQEPASQPAQ